MCGREEQPQEFRPDEPEDIRRIAFSKRYLQEVRARLRRRRLFLSSIGSLCVGPESIQEGDMLCVFLGAEVPFVLRKDTDKFILLNEVYVYGYMDGETLKTVLKEEVFDLH
jgi:hypothetical protein